MGKLTLENVKDIIKEIKNIMNENRKYLNKIDGELGDGDLGITMDKGFNEVYSTINDSDEKDIGKLLIKCSMAMNNVASSTMGTLVATGIMRAGKNVRGREELTRNNIKEMTAAAREGIKERNRAETGDKTMLDALVPAADEIEKGIEDNLSLKEISRNALKAAEEGLEATKEMKAQYGRANYYGDKAIGKQDPGAAAVMLIFQAINNYFNSKEQE